MNTPLDEKIENRVVPVFVEPEITKGLLSLNHDEEEIPDTPTLISNELNLDAFTAIFSRDDNETRQSEVL